MTDLKLLALDTEDLEVISATTQDAVVRVADMAYVQADRQFALLINRFAWELGDSKANAQRRRTALHFKYVEAVSYAGFDVMAMDGVLNLLAVTFSAGEAPAGVIELSFAGGATVRLNVECIEVKLSDTGAAWAASSRPGHDL